METDLRKIKNIARKKEDQNWEFRTFLKGYSTEDLDLIVHSINDRVLSQIDCKNCGNCCREIYPSFDLQDLQKIAQAMQLSQDQFKDKYLKTDKEPGRFVTKVKPCPFLKNNICTQYENRPKSCQSYPHLDKSDFVFRLIGVISNYEICPIVFNVYEALKKEIKYD